MRIAQVIIGYHPTVGGYGRHVSLISEGLRSKGHGVQVLSTKFSPGEYGKERGVKRFWNTPFLKITPGLFKHLLKSNYDLVHVHGYPSFQPFITSIAKKRKDFPLVFTPHYHPTGTKPLALRRVFDWLIGTPALKRADKVIALTSYEKRLLKAKGVKNISVVPNPVKLKSLKKVKGFKKKHGIKGDFVLFVGRIEKDKGLQYLIPAVDLPLVIVGADAGYRKKLPKKDNVIFTGSISQKDLMSAYTECSLVAMPSKYEAFGIVFIEAMAYGRPVIGTRIGPVPSIISKAGLTVPFGDVKALRRAVNRVLKNPGNYKHNALKQVKQYDLGMVVKKLEKVYEELT